MLEGKILIVGGAGFIGINLCNKLLTFKEPEEIIIIDNLLSSDPENIPIDSRVNFLYGSITDNEILERIPKDIDWVFHLACFHGNQSSIFNPLADHENNSYASLKLFEKIYKFNCLKKVVYAAAGCAVAEKTYKACNPTKEDDPVSLFHDSPYSISKIIGELYGNYYYQKYDLPFVKARFQNVYGPYEILGAGSWRGTIHTIWRNVIPSFIWKSLNKESLPLDNQGKVSRDFIYVDDLVQGLIDIALKGENGEAYNLATGNQTTILSLANIINDITKNPAPVILKEARDWDRSGQRYGSTIKSKNQLNFTAKTKIKDGLNKTIEWTKKNKEIIIKNINKHRIMIKKTN